MKPGDAWDYWSAMQNPAFANLIQFGGPAAMGFGTGSQQTTGTYGTPQEIAALQLAQAQALKSAQDALMQLIAAAHGSSTAVTSLGTASAAVAATMVDQLNTSFQNAFLALQTATDLYQHNLIDNTAYDKAVAAYQTAAASLLGASGTASTALTTLAMSATTLTSSTQQVASAMDKALANIGALNMSYQAGTTTITQLDQAWQAYDATIAATTSGLGNLGQIITTTQLEGAAAALARDKAMQAALDASRLAWEKANPTVPEAIAAVGQMFEVTQAQGQANALARDRAMQATLDALRIAWEKANPAIPQGAFGLGGNALSSFAAPVFNPTATNVGPLTVSPHTLTSVAPGWTGVGQGINVTVNIPGTIVGPGGISGVTSAISNELVNQLARQGIRLTRG